jgi:hypothetical protein
MTQPTNKHDAYWRNNDYVIPIFKGAHIVTVLGEISSRKDGRFNWFRKRSRLHVTWTGYKQGIASSDVDAKRKVEDGWMIEKQILPKK